MFTNPKSSIGSPPIQLENSVFVVNIFKTNYNIVKDTIPFINQYGGYVITGSKDKLFGKEYIELIEEKPITVFEFGKELNKNNKNLDVFIKGKTNKDDYLKWIEPYLCYFSTPLDNRCDVSNSQKAMMLLPKGIKEPKIFQKSIPLDFGIFTNSIRDFYPENMM